MKIYLKVSILFAIVAAVVFALYLIKGSSKPESAFIAEEREKFVFSKDNKGTVNDQISDRAFEDKVKSIDIRLANAYIAEKKPDEAIKILERLIKEESRHEEGNPKRSRSYLDQAAYYEMLVNVYTLKNDTVAAGRAAHSREEMLAKAEELRKKEDLAEGKSFSVHER